MLDPKFIREKPDEVKANMEKKNKDASLVDSFLEADKQYRELLVQEQQLRSQRNSLSKQVNELKKKGEDATQVLEQVKQIPQKIKELDEQIQSQKEKLGELQRAIPNIMHESVPLGKTDADNVETKRFGEPQENQGWR